MFHELFAVHEIKTFGSSHMVGLFASHTTFICAVVVRESNLPPSRDVQDGFMLVSTAVKMETMRSLVFEWDR